MSSDAKPNPDLVTSTFTSSQDKTLDQTHSPTSTSSSSSLPPFLVSLLAGACAGWSVDMALYPLDTLKTRMQSEKGFLAAGGFTGVYQGIKSVAIGSSPGSALFFLTYDTTRRRLAEHNASFSSLSTSSLSLSSTTSTSSYPTGRLPWLPQLSEHSSTLIAASMGEAAACLVRVPTDNIKMRMQTDKSLSITLAIKDILYGSTASSSSSSSSSSATTATASSSSSPSSPTHSLSSSSRPSPLLLYRGYLMTLMRDVPFAAIQFPLYEFTRKSIASYSLPISSSSTSSSSSSSSSMTTKNKTIDDNNQVPTPGVVTSALCGGIAGGISAALTCPLDVFKTRYQLGNDSSSISNTSDSTTNTHSSKRTLRSPRATLQSMVRDALQRAEFLAHAEQAEPHSSGNPPHHNPSMIGSSSANIANSNGGGNGGGNTTKTIPRSTTVAPGPTIVHTARGVGSVFFAGVVPRVSWISVGGVVFFGAFETAKAIIESLS